MNTSSFSSSSSIFSPKLPTNPTRYSIGPNRLRIRNNPITIISASKRDGYGYGHDCGGGLVDENMVVLRKRIEELRVAERMDQDPPENGMEWEENCYESCYGSDVCQAVGLIQMFAMSLRPRVALGLVGLILFSVPVSVILVGFNLGQALRFLVN